MVPGSSGECEVDMKDDLLKEAETIATRMDIVRADMMTRRVAEQSMRGVALRYVVRAVGRAVAVAFRALADQTARVLATPTHADRLHDPEHAAIR
jgi:hypothetical protein